MNFIITGLSNLVSRSWRGAGHEVANLSSLTVSPCVTQFVSDSLVADTSFLTVLQMFVPIFSRISVFKKEG